MSDLDHKAVIASLTSGQREALLRRSDAAGLTRLGIHLGSIGICAAALLAAPIWLKPPLMLVQGILLVFLFTTLHETVHQTPFRNRRLNDWVGRLCGLIVFLEPKWFRHFHLAHHRYTNVAGSDPEISQPRPATLGQYLWYMCGVPETFARMRGLVRNATRSNEDPFVPSRGKVAIKRAAQIQLLLYLALLVASVLAGSSVLVVVWLLPMVFGGPFLRGYLLAEHAGCPETPSMFENTRTTFTTSLVRMVAWNMPYHAEHHAYPAVPFYKLPEFHEHAKANLAATEDGYVRFNRKYLASISQS